MAAVGTRDIVIVLGSVARRMASTRTIPIDAYVPETMRGYVAGGLASVVLALLQLFVVSATGVVATVLLLVVWPVLGGAIASTIASNRSHDPSLAGVLAGAYGALVLGLVVLLTGLAGVWTAGVHGTFGVSLWPVVFTVVVVTTVGWTVFGYAGGYLAGRTLAG